LGSRTFKVLKTSKVSPTISVRARNLSSEKSVEEVARDLGIAHSNLRRWRAQYRRPGELAFPGHGKVRLTPQEEENRRLKKELADIQQERDILKKALAIFSKKP